MQQLSGGRSWGRALFATVVLAWPLLAAAPASAQVIQTDGPFGGSLSALFEVGGTIWLGTGALSDPNGGGRVFRSEDDGVTWQPADEGMPNRAVFEFAHTGGVLYAATSQGVYRRADAATSWERADPSYFLQTRSLAVTPGGDVLAGGRTGFFVSQDGGDTFVEMSDGLPVVPQNDAILVEGGNWWLGGTDAFNRATVWKWDDMAQSWSESTLFPGGSTVDSLALHAGKVFAGARGAGLFATADGGDTWDSSNTGLPTAAEGPIIWQIVPAGTDLYVANRTGVYKSVNDGASFATLNAFVCGCDVPGLVLSGNALVLATTAGLFRSENDGADWSPANDGIVASEIEALVELDDGTLIAGSRGAGVFLSDDQGASWTLPATDLGSSFIRGLALSSTGSVHASSWTGGFLRSTDGGNIWRFRLFTSGFQHMAAVGDWVYASSSSNGIRVTSNDGDDWQPLNDGLADTVVNALTASAGVVYAGTASGQVYRADPGQPWTTLGAPVGFLIRDLAVTDGGDLWVAAQGGGPFLLAAGETDFVLAAEGLPYGSAEEMFAQGDDVILDLASISGSTWIRLGGDTSWRPFDSGVPAREARSFLRTVDGLYIGTDSSGVRRSPLPEPAAGLSGLAVLVALALAARAERRRRLKDYLKRTLF